MIFDGKVIKVYKQSGNWACFRFEDKKTKMLYTAKGTVENILIPDAEISLTGDFVDTEKYGRQIEISNLELKSSGTVMCLAKCVKGVGISLAKEIVKTYGDECIDQILENPSILLKVKGIKKKKFEMIVESIKKQDDIKTYLDIFAFFKNDITQSQVTKIAQACKSKVISFEKIKKNPYWIIKHIEGFGFKRVDKLALAAGIEEFSVERIGAAIVFCLQQMSQVCGHCFADMDTLSNEVSTLIIGEPEGLNAKNVKLFKSIVSLGEDSAINEFLKKNDKHGNLLKWKEDYEHLIDVMCEALIEDEKEELIVIEDEKIYWKDLYSAEVETAKIISQMTWEAPVKKVTSKNIRQAIQDMEDYEDCALSDEQKDAVITSVTSRLSIITGGPGRGNTTIIKTIIGAWNKDDDIILLAPTGKAAKRITESTGYPASTIHRFRNKIRQEEQSLKREKAKEKDLDARPKKKLIIIDEVSMVGIRLGLSLLKLARYCNLILVGDVDQLASIEPGLFMKDIIESKIVPVSRLTKGFRNGGSIAINSDLVNKGKGTKYFVLDEHFTFMEAYDEDVLNATIETYRTLLEKYKANEIGILSPIKSRGYGSVKLINDTIRKEFNESFSTERPSKSGYFDGDRVMFIRNNYKKIVTNGFEEEEGVFNGDTGTVMSIDDSSEEADVLFDDGRRGTFSFDEMVEDFILANATTIHKSQGSEYKAVIVIMSSQHIFFLKRNLLYTAMTRAKEELYIIGDKKAIGAAIRNVDDSVRNTNLKEQLSKEVEKLSV